MSDTTKTPITIDVSGDFNQASADHERSNWVHRIVLDVDARSVDTCTMYGNGTPGRIWSGVDREIGRINDGVADTDDLQTYLESDEAQALLEAIIAGWESHHDGSNFVGTLTEDAQNAEQALSDAISEMELPTYWDAGDYLSADARGVMDGCDGTDEWFTEHVDSEVEDAKPDAWLDHADVEKYLRHEWEQKLESKLDDVGDFIVPPECQGQIVERAYAMSTDGSTVWCRIADGSDKSVVYEMADARDDDEGDYWNGVPQVDGEWSRFTM